MYVLTLANGAVLKFYLLTCAEIYQQCWGGELVYKVRELGDTVEV